MNGSGQPRVAKPNRRFDFITKYICKLKDRSNWESFCQEFYVFIQLNPEYGLQDFQAVLEKHGLKWSEESMKAFEIGSLDEKTALALILGVLNAERFAEGALETFITDGCIANWLGRLKAIDDESK